MRQKTDDNMGKFYPSHEEIIPITWGNFTHVHGEILPITWGNGTHY